MASVWRATTKPPRVLGGGLLVQPVGVSSMIRP